jgi:hypothetical protein
MGPDDSCFKLGSKQEQEMIALRKKNARLIKESTREGKARVKVSHWAEEGPRH